MSKEFNLISEPWIKVLDNACCIQEISVKDCLLNAHMFKGLSGETKAQDLAIMRLLIAILYSVFTRINPDNEMEAIEDVNSALDRWEEIWDKNSFPSQPIIEYLNMFYDRFWLFADDRPFYQIIEAKIGTYNSAAKLNGAIGESNNKLRMFSSKAGLSKSQMSFAEAARWLLYINGFDDTSAKPKGKGLPSPGAGWLGKIGLIQATGENLFESLMLNLTFLKDGNELWAPIKKEVGSCAIWELDSARTDERTEIAQPLNIAGLYTLQSRRILLSRAENAVTGYYLLGGDFFDRQNAFAEQMTIWRYREEKGKGYYTPRRHDPSLQMWREFSTIAVQDVSHHRPGVLSWIDYLTRNNILNGNKKVKFNIISVQYGDKDFFVTDAFNDELTFGAKLLDGAGTMWQIYIEKEIQNCDACARNIGRLAVDLAKASGDSGEINKQNAKEVFYATVDRIFREWLYELDPDEHEENYIDLLRKQVKNIALQIGQNLINEAGPKAFSGRVVTEMINNKEEKRYYSSPRAFNYYLYSIRKIYEEVK